MMCTQSINTYFNPISRKTYNKLLYFTATFFNIRYCKILECGMQHMQNTWFL